MTNTDIESLFTENTREKRKCADKFGEVTIQPNFEIYTNFSK